MKTIKASIDVLVLISMLGVLGSTVCATEADPTACLREIQTVCVHLEDKLESCLSDRGNQLSTACRDQLKSAISVMQDPSGPAACMPDVQRLCPHLESQALSQCISDNQNNFSEPCRSYLQSVSQKPASSK